MDFAFFLIQLLNGLQYGLLLFLVASGLTLVFGIMGIINLAHGSFYMVGAYLAWSLASMTGSLTTAILLAIPLTVILGMALERLLFRHLYAARPSLPGAADLRPDSGLRGTAQPDLGRRRAWRRGAGPAQCFDSADRQSFLPGVSPGDLRRLPAAGGRAVFPDPENAPGHDDPRRRQQPRDGAVAGHRHQADLHPGIRAGHRSGGLRRHDQRAAVVGVRRTWAAMC